MFWQTYRNARSCLAVVLAMTVVLLLTGLQAKAAELRVAVAANFTEAAKEIGALFEAESGYRPIFSFGATGQLYTQISQGAPFAVFLAADQVRPEKAIAEGLAVPGSQFTYARGRLAVFSREDERVAGEESLADGGFEKLAIANPLTAPYGAAALEALKALGLHESVAPKLVQGNNISQAFQFVATGNAELGFVALAQLSSYDGGSYWVVPASLHEAIAQDAVLLTYGENSQAARAFLAFLGSEQARAVLARYGYQG